MIKAWSNHPASPLQTLFTRWICDINAMASGSILLSQVNKSDEEKRTKEKKRKEKKNGHRLDVYHYLQ